MDHLLLMSFFLFSFFFSFSFFPPFLLILFLILTFSHNPVGELMLILFYFNIDILSLRLTFFDTVHNLGTKLQCTTNDSFFHYSCYSIFAITHLLLQQFLVISTFSVQFMGENQITKYM